MKSVEMIRTFSYRPLPRVVQVYEAGKTYHRVPEAAVAAIVQAGAGRVIRPSANASRVASRDIG